MLDEDEGHIMPSKVNIGIFFSTVGVIVLILAFFYDTYVIFNITQQVAREVDTLNARISNNEQHLSVTQNTLNQLSQSITQTEETLHQAAIRDQEVGERYARLSTLDATVDQLPLIDAEKKEGLQLNETPSMNSSQTSWWQRVLANMSRILRQVIVVQYIGSDNLIYQYLHAQLSSAMWGVLHHNTIVYQTSLTRASAWVMQNFDQHSPLTQSFLASLQTMQNVDVSSVPRR